MPGLDREFLELKVAKAWGLTPRQWRAEPLDDKALMMSYEMFCETVEAYRAEWQERKRTDKGAKGVNPYQALLAGMGLKQ